jgi:hypothetical protein
LEILQANLLSPIVLAFMLGIFAKLIRSDLSLPKELYSTLSLYLLFALGLKGGVELTHASLHEIGWPALVTVLIGCITPVSAYLGMRYLGRFSVSDSAGVAAHYGSVSAVTFIAAQSFCNHLGLEVEGYMPTLLTFLECPGILIALCIGAIGMAQATAPAVMTSSGGALTLGGGGSAGVSLDTDVKERTWKSLHEVITGRSMVLLVGGLVIGFLIGSKGYEPVKGFFESGFRGALTLFLLEMGLVAGARLSDLKSVGGFLLCFGIIVPIAHGLLGVTLGYWAGLSIGGCTILGTMAASASYIAAPPAVRMTLPEANPTYSLTLALAITFPFNLVLGIPLYHQMAAYLFGA